MSRMLADILEILTPGTPDGESALERLLAQLVAQGKEQLSLLRQHGQLMARIERGLPGGGTTPPPANGSGHRLPS